MDTSIISDVIRRTGMEEEDAEYYVAKARARILRRIPDIEWTEAVEDAAADIAVLLWQRDVATRNTIASLGYSKESIKEGAISKSKSAMDGTLVRSTYEDDIDRIIRSLAGDHTDGKVKFL